ncbi:transposase [Opitutus sp. GAS368]|jgi:putative transposase|uniref:transposase n=1 Tax=Opitutus sp. GAS368 TaxID=1882749 RepID=UPI00087A26E9|nr:transposase [Opitutus sp. GAS368]SDR68790.1 Transposase IS200 like [Opitutus sp. GAS368]
MPSYPGRLAHQTPAWVETGATYHIRISVDLGQTLPLTDPKIGSALLDSVRFYHERCRWNCRLFLLMPDHLHALLTFPYDKDMGTIIAAWKGYQAKHLGIHWQGNYFDHRIRRRDELEEKAAYLRLNPVRKNLCTHDEVWPWMLECAPENPSGGRVPP